MTLHDFLYLPEDDNRRKVFIEAFLNLFLNDLLDMLLFYLDHLAMEENSDES